MKLTHEGLIADIMRMDHLGFLSIEQYFPDRFLVKLKQEPTDIIDAYLYNFLKTMPAEGPYVRVRLADLDKYLSEHEGRVIAEATERFSSPLFLFNPSRFGRLGFILFGLLSIFLLGFLSIPLNILSMFFTIFLGPYAILLSLAVYLSGPAIILLLISLHKLQSNPLQRKYLFNEILLSLLKLELINLFSSVLLLLPLALAAVFLPLACLSAVPLFVFILYYYDRFGRICFKFFSWLLEPREAGEHRLAWLNFKDFVIVHSEVEKRPISHYELWGPFYYYALAVGAMQNPHAVQSG